MLVKVLVVVGGLALVLARILLKCKVRWNSKRRTEGGVTAGTEQVVSECKPPSGSHVDRDSLGSVTTPSDWRPGKAPWGSAHAVETSAGQRQVGSFGGRSSSGKTKLSSRSKRSSRPRLGLETASRQESVSLVWIGSEQRSGRVRLVYARGDRCSGGEPWLPHGAFQPSHAHPIVEHSHVTVEGDVISESRAGRRTANPVWEDVSALEEWCRPPPSLRCLSRRAPLPRGQRIVRLQVSPHPFHKGSQHQVYHAGYTSAKVQGGSPPRVVLKKCIFENRESGLEARLARMENNAVVLGLAGIFNQKLKSLPRKPPAGWERLRFVKESVVHTLGDSQVRYFLEPFLGWDFDKMAVDGVYSNKMPKKAIDLLEAFAHWTYTKTEGAVMVTQCEVVKADGIFWLRNPTLSCSLHQSSEKVADGRAAMGRFLNKHKCNKYCHAFGASTEPLPKPLKERVKKVLALIEKRAKALRPHKN